MRPLLSARSLPLSQTSRLRTPNTNGVEGVSVWGDGQAEREMQLATEMKGEEMVQDRRAMEQRRRSSSLYSGSMWRKKPSRGDGPSKRMAAKDRIAIAQKKIAAAAGRSDSGSSRTDAADSLVINGRMCVKDSRGVWRDVVSGEPCSD